MAKLPKPQTVRFQTLQRGVKFRTLKAARADFETWLDTGESPSGAETSVHIWQNERANPRGNRRRSKRGAPASSPSQGTSKRATSDSSASVKSRNGAAGMYSCAILTLDELRRIIDSYAVAVGCSASSLAKCNIVERARDGMWSLYVEVEVSPQQKPLPSNLHSVVTPTESL